MVGIGFSHLHDRREEPSTHYNSVIMYTMPLNCHYCLKNNPPLVVFFICLVIMTAATLSLMFCVKNGNKIVNMDARLNWISLTRHLNQLDLCVANNTTNPTNRNYDTSFVTLVNLNLSQFTNVTHIRAYYDLAGWQSQCVGTPDFFTVDLFLAPNLNDSDNGTICGIIKGPREFLPEHSTHSCGFHDDIDDDITLTLHSHPELCISSSNLTEINFLFDANENFVTYLSQDDKTAIYLHLLWSSSILLFLILVMLIYGMFYQREYVLKTYRLA